MIETPDFKTEADLTAVNEACITPEDAKGCAIGSLCITCQALSNSIRSRLIAAYRAGFLAAQPTGLFPPSRG